MRDDGREFLEIVIGALELRVRAREVDGLPLELTLREQPAADLPAELDLQIGPRHGTRDEQDVRLFLSRPENREVEARGLLPVAMMETAGISTTVPSECRSASDILLEPDQRRHAGRERLAHFDEVGKPPVAGRDVEIVVDPDEAIDAALCQQLPGGDEGHILRRVRVSVRA